jgi:DHA2 family methylenomycin A resistance protein-like MFS transporter
MADRFTGTVLAASLGFGLVQLDVSIVNVALVSLGRELHAGIASVAWIVDAYAIAFACTLLSAGALGDRIGSKRVVIAGFAVFGIASLGCALAPSLQVLVWMRVLQGIGASALVPCSLALIAHGAGNDTAKRARAIGVWTAAGAVTLAIGPLVGGALVGTLGWRSIFFINLPICAAAIWLTQSAASETAPRAGSFDPIGQALAVVTLLALTLGIIEAGSLDPSAATIVRIALGTSVLAAAAFLIAEARIRDPLVPLGFFRSRAFSAAVGVGSAINASLYGTLFMFAIYLQRSRDYSPLEVGFALLPFAIVLGIANLAAGPLIGKRGTRLPMIAGLSIALPGFAMLLVCGTRTPYVAMLPALVAIPLGIGFAVPAMTSTLLGTIPRSRSGVASGVLNTARQAAGALGIATAAAAIARAGPVGALHVLTALCLAAISAALGFSMLGIPRHARTQEA